MTPQFSPSTLAGIASTLGRMAAQIDTLKEDVDQIRASAAERSVKIDRIPVIEEHIATLRKEVGDVLCLVEDHERLKQRMIGWMIGTAGAGGVIGGLASKLLPLIS